MMFRNDVHNPQEVSLRIRMIQNLVCQGAAELKAATGTESASALRAVPTNSEQQLPQPAMSRIGIQPWMPHL